MLAQYLNYPCPQKSGHYTSSPSYRREYDDGGGAAGNAIVVVSLYLGNVVAQVAAVVHPAVAAKCNERTLSGIATITVNCLEAIESSPKCPRLPVTSAKAASKYRHAGKGEG